MSRSKERPYRVRMFTQQDDALFRELGLPAHSVSLQEAIEHANAWLRTQRSTPRFALLEEEGSRRLTLVQR